MCRPYGLSHHAFKERANVGDTIVRQPRMRLRSVKTLDKPSIVK